MGQMYLEIHLEITSPRLVPTGIYIQCTMNRSSCQRQSLRSKRLEILSCSWLAPQAVGGEEKVVVNEIKHFHSREPRLLIIDHLGEVNIIKNGP